MKKLLTGLLAVLTCFTCATAVVACGDNNGNNNNSNSESTPSIPEDLQTAADYLEEMYRSKYAETRVDFEVLSAIMGYPITWSVNVAEGVQVVVADGKVTIDVNELLDADLDYVLTALITDEAGNTTTVSFNRKVLAAPSLIPVAITAAPEEGVAYKYHVYQSTLGTDMYFAGGMAATYYFKTTTNYEEAVDVYAEYLAGSTTEFYLYFNHSTDGKQYFGVQVSEDGAHDNIVYKSEPVSFFVWNEELGTVTTHLEATKNNGGPNDFYFGNYGTKDTISASYTSYAGGAGNNVGHLVTMVDKNSITPESKVEESKEALALSFTEVAGAKEMELPAARHADVAVTWAISENAYASIVDGKLVTTNPAADVEVVLTATLTCGEVTATKEFTVTLKYVDNLPAADSVITITKALEIGAAQAHNTYTENKYYIVATIKEVYNAQYGNMYLVDEAGNQFTLYGSYNEDGTVRYDAMESKPVAGDVVKVYGNIGQYNGTAQMKNGWIIEWNAEGVTPDTPAAGTVVTAPVEGVAYYMFLEQNGLSKTLYLNGQMDGNFYAMTDDATQAVVVYAEVVEGGYKFYILNGETKSYLTLTEYQKSNGYWGASVSYSEEGSVFAYNDLGCWTFTGENDTFFLGTYGTYSTTSASASNYMTGFGTSQYPLTIMVAPAGEVTPPAGGEDGGETEEPETPAEIQTLTIPEALALGAQQSHDTYTANKYYVTGMISEVYNATYGNLYIVDEAGNKITVYGTYNEDGSARYDAMANAPQAGDTVKLLAIVGQYNGTAQLKNAWIIEATPASDATKIALEKAALSVISSCTGARTVELATSGATRADVVIAWTVVAGSEIATYADGVLTIVNPAAETTVTVKATLTCGETTDEVSFNIVVSHKNEGAAVEVEATLSFASTANRTAFDTSAQVWEANGVKLTNSKGSSTSNVADYSNPARFYKSSTITIECNRMTKIVFVCNSTSYATALNDSLTAAGITATVSGSNVTIEFANEENSVTFTCSGGQVRMNSLTVTYNS